MAIFYEEHAQILYDLAKAHHNLEAVYNDVQLFKSGVGGEMPFMQMMTREQVPNSSKIAFLNDVSQFFQEETKQFFQFFMREMKFEYIYRAIKHFEYIYHTHHLTITSAVPLTQQQIQQITEKTSRKMNCVIDTVDTQVDATVIGGIKVQSHEFIIDATLLAQLKAFQSTV